MDDWAGLNIANVVIKNGLTAESEDSTIVDDETTMDSCLL
jgi:hypothetical protein